MAATEIVIEEGSSGSIMNELFNLTSIYRLSGATFRFGFPPCTDIPVILEAPTDIPAASDFICFFGWPKRSSKTRALFEKIQTRLLTVKDVPAHAEEFQPQQLLACETIGHETRYLACFEKDPVKRSALFDQAYRIHEGVVLALCHSSVNELLRIISRDESKVHLHQPWDVSLGCISDPGRRLLSHCFASMAMCIMMGQGTFAKYVSLASAAVSWEPSRAVELACTLRILPVLATTSFFTPQAQLAMQAAGSANASMAVIPGSVKEKVVMSKNVSEKVLLPLLLRLGRQELFDHELSLIPPENRAEIERFSRACLQHAATVPTPLRTMRTHVVDGRVIERMCAACGVWDRTGKGHLRCSRCMQAYYCGKSCQLGHWGEHKMECNKTRAKRGPADI